jgi:GNAT superfamily N-acetyltransferase
LCRAHAAFERAEIATPDAARLRRALFAPPVKLLAWVATEESDRPIGYATATLDYSTWRARDFMHLDCLFVESDRRGDGIGRWLVDAVCRAARELEIDELQWQTPDWNIAAQRFYSRLGAQARAKTRFTLRL